MDSLYCEVVRNAITFHRNQIKFVLDCARNGSPRHVMMKLAKKHAAEIKGMLAQVEFERKFK